MKRLLLLFLLLVSSNLTFAASEKAIPRFYTQSSTGTFYFPTQELACRNYFDRVYAQQGTLVSATVSYAAGGTDRLGICYVRYITYSNGGTAVINTGVSVSYSCRLPGSTIDNGDGFISNVKCVTTSCPTGTTLNTTTNSCEDVCKPKSGKDATININCSSTNAPSLVCMPDSCVAQMTGSAVGQKNGCYFGYAYGKYNGQSCTGQPNSTNYSNPTQAPVEPEPSPETDCIKQGKTFGSVNGVTVCVPKSSSGGTPVTTKNDTKTTTTNTDTSGNTTTSTSEKSENVTKDGDQITTTTTKTNADGTKSEETKTETTASFCATNPTSPYCKAPKEDEEGVDCEENPDLPACMKAGQPSDNEVIAGETRTVSFTPLQITSGGSCPPDKSVSVAGKSMTFSYSWICQYASMFKPFMMAFAYLSAAMFLFSGFKGAQA